MSEKSLFKLNDDGSLKSLKSGFHVDISGMSVNNDGGIRIGVDYQADLPDCISSPYFNGRDNPKSILVWYPNSENLDLKVDHYLEISAEKYGYNQEQALGLLFWHDHNIDKSLSDLPNFVPIPEHWDMLDQVLFEQAFAFYGKNFHRIHSMMTEKSVGSLVKYYYSWKRLRNRTSGLEKKTENIYKKLSSSRSSSSGSENSPEQEIKPKVYICSKEGGRNRKISHPGVFLDAANLQKITSIGAEELLKKMDSELQHLQRKVVTMRANINYFKLKNNLSIDHLKPPETSLLVDQKWTQNEMLLCVLGFSRYGKDYEKIAELIGTKDETLVADFYQNYRQRYNLDLAIEEYYRDCQKEGYKNMGREALDQWPTERIKTKGQITSDIYHPTQDNHNSDNRINSPMMDMNQSNAPLHQMNKSYRDDHRRNQSRPQNK